MPGKSNEYILHSEFDVDALPYVDRDLDDDEIRAAAERMIEQEMRLLKKSERSELTSSINFFENNQILKQEIERIQQKKFLDTLDSERYELKGPSNEDDVDAWKSAVNNTKSQLESQAGSMFNLELLSKYGATAWRVHNYQLEKYLEHSKSNTEHVRTQITNINRERKTEQAQAAIAISALENKWSDLISQNLQVEIACAALEAEITELKSFKK